MLASAPISLSVSAVCTYFPAEMIPPIWCQAVQITHQNNAITSDLAYTLPSAIMERHHTNGIIIQGFNAKFEMDLMNLFFQLQAEHLQVC